MIKKLTRKAMAVFTSITLVLIILPGVPVHATQTRKNNFSRSYDLTGNGAQDIINVAMAQIGKTGSDLGYSEEWCANFVSDCADLAGQGEAVPRTGAVSNEYSSARPWWGLRQTIIQAGGHNVGLDNARPGDIVFFSGHVEIVYSGTGSNIVSIGGNTGSGGSCYSRVVCSPRKHGSPIAVLRPNYKGFPDPDAIGHVMSESEAAGRTLLDGDYWICSGYNMDYYLDIPGVEISPSGTNVWMWNYKNEMPTSCDVWTVTYLNNGFYRIKQKDSSVSLDVNGGTVDRGANVQLWSDNNSNAQQWSIARTDHGYTLQARCSAFFMDIYDAGTENGTNVSTYTKNGERWQNWCFIPYKTDERPIADGVYNIQTACDSNYYVDAEGAHGEFKNETNIILYNETTDSFKVSYVGDGWYSICEASSGLSLDVYNKDTSQFLDVSMNIQLHTSNQGRNQLWKIRNTGDGCHPPKRTTKLRLIDFHAILRK